MSQNASREIWPDTIGHIDSSQRVIHLERVQDCEPLVEHNKSLQGTRQNSDWGRHVASVPNVFLEKWLNEELARGHMITSLYSPEMDEVVARKLQDPDYRWLRTDL